LRFQADKIQQYPRNNREQQLSLENYISSDIKKGIGIGGSQTTREGFHKKSTENFDINGIGVNDFPPSFISVKRATNPFAKTKYENNTTEDEKTPTSLEKYEMRFLANFERALQSQKDYARTGLSKTSNSNTKSRDLVFCSIEFGSQKGRFSSRDRKINEKNVLTVPTLSSQDIKSPVKKRIRPGTRQAVTPPKTSHRELSTPSPSIEAFPNRPKNRNSKQGNAFIRQLFQFNTFKRAKCSCDQNLKEDETCSRALYWISKKYKTSEFQYLKTTYEKILSENKLQDPDQKKQIQKDLDRTYPSNKYFSSGAEGNKSLERILNTFSKYDPQIGRLHFFFNNNDQKGMFKE